MKVGAKAQGQFPDEKRIVNRHARTKNKNVADRLERYAEKHVRRQDKLDCQEDFSAGMPMGDSQNDCFPPHP